MKTIIVYEGEASTKLPRLYMDDYGQSITFHVINENTSAVNLTDFTVTFIVKKLNQFDETLFQEVCTITDTENGYCRLDIPDELKEQGTFDAFLKLEKTGFNERINLGHFNIW